MCGRYTVTCDLDELLEEFGVGAVDWVWTPRYNVAPTQEVPVVVRGKHGGRRMGPVRWGLVPFWAEGPSVGSRMINARSESVETKPAFRRSFQLRRCLVPADGFYEWTPRGGRKVPWWIHRPDGRPFAFAGLWEKWVPPEEGAEPLYTFTIVTTAANARLRRLHDRMPVIVPPRAYDLWLDRQAPLDEVRALLRPGPEDLLTFREVSPRVGSPRNDDPTLTEAVLPPDPGLALDG